VTVPCPFPFSVCFASRRLSSLFSILLVSGSLVHSTGRISLFAAVSLPASHAPRCLALPMSAVL
jgi:hypothetical protein